VGEVGLPHFIRLFGFEPDVGGFRFLLRPRGDQPGALQGPPDAGHRHLQLVVLGQVPGNRGWTRVQPLTGQLLSQLDDQLHRRFAQRGRLAVRPTGARVERCISLGAVASHQLIDPRPSHPIGGRHLPDGTAFDKDSSDHQTGPRHPRKSSLAASGMSCDIRPLCHETGHRHPLQPKPLVSAEGVHPLGRAARRRGCRPYTHHPQATSRIGSPGPCTASTRAALSLR
jgi:hypothetical protein